MNSFKDKVVYQIYPKSFYDSNGDGLGDVKGIIEKMEYLHLLGVDYLWITPIFVSPQNDNGYDVANYREIDPSYGTMEDVEELIRVAQSYGISIMFDMVFNHTSTSHKWFQNALQGVEDYKDYYYFKKSSNGTLPTNWESKFGGDVWEYVEEFDEYYLHLFDKTQADLNWKNPKVRKELADVVNFWIDKGIKGFRFDVVNLISKDAFEDDYEGVGKRFYTDGKNAGKYLNELNRESFGKYDDMLTVGEMSATTVDHCIGYTNPKNQQLDMTFNFHHLKVDYKNKEKWTSMPFDFEELKELLHSWQTGMQEGNGWNALFWNCHDQPRSISRFGNDGVYHDLSSKMLATVIHLQRGTPYIYQGEEIGMTNNYFTSIDQYRDVETINHYEILKDKKLNDDEITKILQSKSRDNARSPMQWTADGGFSEDTPWMQMNSNCKDINVEANISDQTSIFHYYRKLIQLRKNYKIISEGLYQPMFEEVSNVFAYKRTYNDEELIVLNNFYDTEVEVKIANRKMYSVMISNYIDHIDNDVIILRPYESIALYKK